MTREVEEALREADDPNARRIPMKKSCRRCRHASTKHETSHVDWLTEISAVPAYNLKLVSCS